MNTNCDACSMDVPHTHGDNPRIYTYGIVYPEPWGIEEIDLLLSRDNPELAVQVAKAGYQLGWQEIKPLAPGGSSGLIYF